MALFDRFKKGLSRTRDKLVTGLRGVLSFGRKIDDTLLDELADAMLVGDMGPHAVMALQEEIRDAWKAGKISGAPAIGNCEWPPPDQR
jgi:fused signal recognition particle receptor